MPILSFCAPTRYRALATAGLTVLILCLPGTVQAQLPPIHASGTAWLKWDDVGSGLLCATGLTTTTNPVTELYSELWQAELVEPGWILTPDYRQPKVEGQTVAWSANVPAIDPYGRYGYYSCVYKATLGWSWFGFAWYAAYDVEAVWFAGSPSDPLVSK